MKFILWKVNSFRSRDSLIRDKKRPHPGEEVVEKSARRRTLLGEDWVNSSYDEMEAYCGKYPDCLENYSNDPDQEDALNSLLDRLKRSLTIRIDFQSLNSESLWKLMNFLGFFVTINQDIRFSRIGLANQRLQDCLIFFKDQKNYHFDLQHASLVVGFLDKLSLRTPPASNSDQIDIWKGPFSDICNVFFDFLYELDMPFDEFDFLAEFGRVIAVMDSQRFPLFLTKLLRVESYPDSRDARHCPGVLVLEIFSAIKELQFSLPVRRSMVSSFRDRSLIVLQSTHVMEYFGQSGDNCLSPEAMFLGLLEGDGMGVDYTEMEGVDSVDNHLRVIGMDLVNGISAAFGMGVKFEGVVHGATLEPHWIDDNDLRFYFFLLLNFLSSRQALRVDDAASAHIYFMSEIMAEHQPRVTSESLNFCITTLPLCDQERYMTKREGFLGALDQQLGILRGVTSKVFTDTKHARIILLSWQVMMALLTPTPQDQIEFNLRFFSIFLSKIGLDNLSEDFAAVVLGLYSRLTQLDPDRLEKFLNSPNDEERVIHAFFDARFIMPGAQSWKDSLFPSDLPDLEPSQFQIDPMTTVPAVSDTAKNEKARLMDIGGNFSRHLHPSRHIQWELHDDWKRAEESQLMVLSIPGDGDCAFWACGTTREAVIQYFRDHVADLSLRKFMVSEIVHALISESFTHSKFHIVKYFETQTAIDEAVRALSNWVVETTGKHPSFSDVTATTVYLEWENYCDDMGYTGLVLNEALLATLKSHVQSSIAAVQELANNEDVQLAYLKAHYEDIRNYVFVPQDDQDVGGLIHVAVRMQQDTHSDSAGPIAVWVKNRDLVQLRSIAGGPITDENKGRILHIMHTGQIHFQALVPKDADCDRDLNDRLYDGRITIGSSLPYDALILTPPTDFQAIMEHPSATRQSNSDRLLGGGFGG